MHQINYPFAKALIKTLLDYLAISKSQVKVIEEYDTAGFGIYELFIQNSPILSHIDSESLGNILKNLSNSHIKFSILAKSPGYTFIRLKIKSTEVIMDLINEIHTDNAYLGETYNEIFMELTHEFFYSLVLGYQDNLVLKIFHKDKDTLYWILDLPGDSDNTPLEYYLRNYGTHECPQYYTRNSYFLINPHILREFSDIENRLYSKH